MTSPRMGGLPSRAAMGMMTAVALLALVLGAPLQPASADLKLCNKTGNRVGIAIGHKGAEGWVTEGWWTVAPSACETLLKGDLVSRYYYIHALDYDIGVEWSGKSFMCTQDKAFTIHGVDDCAQRGFELTGFVEIDTGEEGDWTVQLTESGRQGTGGQ